ncbi:MAG TPA: thioredoxin family protein [Chthoniobacterales bacterium]
MKISRLTLLAFLCALLVVAPARAELNWLTDFQKAQQDAKTSHKLLLINFTGSDWCPWCLRLHRDVFSKPEFESYARDHLVLVMADFPRAKPLSKEVRRQNQELAERFGVQGFPTIVVLNGEGKQVGELGYVPGGATAFIDELKRLPQS